MISASNATSYTGGEANCGGFPYDRKDCYKRPGSAMTPISFKSIPRTTDMRFRSDDNVFNLEKHSWTSVAKILPRYFVERLKNPSGWGNNWFGGDFAVSSDNITSIKNMDYALTPGFYELHKTISNYQTPMHTYMFVTNADAPTLDEEHTPICLFGDERICNCLKNVPFPND